MASATSSLSPETARELLDTAKKLQKCAEMALRIILLSPATSILYGKLVESQQFKAGPPAQVNEIIARAEQEMRPRRFTSNN